MNSSTFSVTLGFGKELRFLGSVLYSLNIYW